MIKLPVLHGTCQRRGRLGPLRITADAGSGGGNEEESSEDMELVCLMQLHGPGVYSMQASTAKEHVLRFSVHQIYCR